MRSRRSLKLSHTQTSVPCGTLNYTYGDEKYIIHVYIMSCNEKILYDTKHPGIIRHINWVNGSIESLFQFVKFSTQATPGLTLNDGKF